MEATVTTQEKISQLFQEHPSIDAVKYSRLRDQSDHVHVEFWNIHANLIFAGKLISGSGFDDLQRTMDGKVKFLPM